MPVVDAEMAKPPLVLYKVLGALGQSIHGGNGTWFLPQDDQPGEWMPAIQGPLEICARGYHLTSDPFQWWTLGARVFEAEWKSGDLDKSGDKYAVRDVRLLREANWADFGVYLDGAHQHEAGEAVAAGSASVRASGSARVRAYGSARVTASDSTTVTAYDRTTVKAYDNVTVTACDNVTVTAYGSASVTASDRASVTASDRASVTAYDSVTVTAYHSASVTAYGSVTVTASDCTTVTASGRATVTASGSVTVTASDSTTVTASGSTTVKASGSVTVTSTASHMPSAVVALEHMAAHIDRRGGGLVLRGARGGEHVVQEAMDR
jgi:hypothetical protein